MERLAEPVFREHDPGWGVALRGPVIVYAAELCQGPGPETMWHVGVFEHATNVFLGDTHGIFSTCLHRVIIPCRGAHDDVPVGTPSSKTI